MAKAALAGLLLAVSGALFAADKEEKIVVKKEEAPVAAPVVRQETVTTTTTTHEVVYEEKRSGHPIKNFWVHSVGGSIGNGLKKGANKIGNTFD